MRRSIPIAFATLIAACTQSTPPQTGSAPTPVAAPAQSGPCATGFVEIAPDRPACGIALETDGSLSIAERRTAPVVVSSESGANGQTAITAKELVLFPPAPQSGLRIIQACEGAAAESLCWAVRLLDPEKAVLHDVAAGKYGPSHWIRWSPGEHRVALISRDEGAEWVHIIDTASGAATTYPGAAENANWKIDRESFAWNGENAFTVKVKACESCAPATRSFTLP